MIWGGERSCRSLREGTAPALPQPWRCSRSQKVEGERQSFAAKGLTAEDAEGTAGNSAGNDANPSKGDKLAEKIPSVGTRGSPARRAYGRAARSCLKMLSLRVVAWRPSTAAGIRGFISVAMANQQ